MKDNIQSKINPALTLEYMINEGENIYFDRKSAKVRPSELAGDVSAFANAEGGTLVIGISDKTREIEGINGFGDDKINDFINLPKDFCKPMPKYETEFLDVVNYKGDNDRILLIHIEADPDQIIRTQTDSAFLRIGDRSKEMKGDDLKNLEYSKRARLYEDEINYDATIEDLDKSLLTKYKKNIKANKLTNEQVLQARGFIKKKDGKEYLTNAAVLLFAKNIQQFYPNCRIRFVRYDGVKAFVGTKINIIKDVNIEEPVLKIIDKAKEFIATQLREFTALDQTTGKFEIVPEYPEFAWIEGIVNAVTHREYSMTGSYILVAMYDDRLEIQSPGTLPSIVTIENITSTRFSRNPRMARVLTEFGWVRELNEGVKRIYSDMKEFFLEEPEYSEPNQHVKLVLKNNIVMRTLRQAGRAQANVGIEKWNQLDDLEKLILTYMGSRKEVKRAELTQVTGKADRTIARRINHLLELGVIRRNGNINDPNQTYEII